MDPLVMLSLALYTLKILCAFALAQANVCPGETLYYFTRDF